MIASNFGRRQHPAWYHNLRHSPDGEVTIDGAARRASHRQIAVFVLEA